MKHYKIADLYVDIDCKCDILKRRLKKYEIDASPNPDFSIKVTEEQVENLLKKAPHLTPSEAEYILVSGVFSRHILRYQRFYLHSSAIAYKNKAILFSADSGVGKSTHTKLWQGAFGSEVTIINDDKPTLALKDDHIDVYGTPFSGNSDENENMCVPLYAIVFIKRDKTNHMRRLTVSEAIPLIMRQTTRYTKSYQLMDQLMILLDAVLKTTPVYELSCNMDIEACFVAKETLFPEK